MTPLQCTLLVLLLATISAARADDAGKIEAEKGTLTITDAKGQAKAATVGSLVDNGDVINTGAQSWVVLNMVDGASLTLRPDTRVRIVAYHFEDEQPANNKSWLELFAGTLRSITGLIGHQNPRDYSLKTPTATVGVRGTDHETTVIDDAHASADSPAGTYDNVNDGATVLKDEQGEVEVHPGTAGFLRPDAHAVPQLLQHPPLFLARWRQFDQRQGINRVLGRLHLRIGGGAFGLHPQVRERLQRQWPHYFRAPAVASRKPMAERGERQAGSLRERLGARRWRSGEERKNHGEAHQANREGGDGSRGGGLAERRHGMLQRRMLNRQPALAAEPGQRKLGMRRRRRHE